MARQKTALVAPVPRSETPPFQVGDRVTSRLYREQQNIVRRITWVEKSSKVPSGWLASADEGNPCPCCQSAPGIPIGLVDAAWFRAAPPCVPAAPPWTFLEDDVFPQDPQDEVV